MKLKADEVFADYDPNEILIIGFSGTLNNEPYYLMIQDAYDREDEQEIELGMDTYYMELNDQSRGGYGGITEIQIWENTVLLNLNDLGKENLQTESDTILIEIDINAAEFKNLKEKLNIIFEPEKQTTIYFHDGIK